MAVLKKSKKKKEVYIRFIARVVPQTTDKLFQMLDQKIKEKYNKIHLLLSSPGGSVFNGLSLYNYLKGAPLDIATYNFGSVDSIGVIVFCAGSERYSVPHARFLIHGVRFTINGSASFDEKQIEEHLKSLKIDQHNIAKILADTVGKPIQKIEEDMNNRTTLNPTEAKDYGLVHQIKSELFPHDAEILTVGDYSVKYLNAAYSATEQKMQGYAKSVETDIGTL